MEESFTMVEHHPEESFTIVEHHPEFEHHRLYGDECCLLEAPSIIERYWKPIISYI